MRTLTGSWTTMPPRPSAPLFRRCSTPRSKRTVPSTTISIHAQIPRYGTRSSACSKSSIASGNRNGIVG